MSTSSKYCIRCKKDRNENVTYHRFPSDRNLCKLWCKVLRLDINKIPKYAYVCSKHFSLEQFRRITERNILKKDAVPRMLKFDIFVGGFHKTKPSIGRNERDSTIPVDHNSGTEEEQGTSDQTVKEDEEYEIDLEILSWSRLVANKVQELDGISRKSMMLRIDKFLHHIKMLEMIQESTQASMPFHVSKDNERRLRGNVTITETSEDQLRNSSEDDPSETESETEESRLLNEQWEDYDDEGYKIEYYHQKQRHIPLEETKKNQPSELEYEIKTATDANEIVIEYHEIKRECEEIEIKEESLCIPETGYGEIHREGELESDATEIKTECEEFEIDEESLTIPIEVNEVVPNERRVHKEGESECYAIEMRIENEEIEMDEDTLSIPVEINEDILNQSSESESEIDTQKNETDIEEMLQVYHIHKIPNKRRFNAHSITRRKDGKCWK